MSIQSEDNQPWFHFLSPLTYLPANVAAFKFVLDASEPSSRSHKMCEHWEQRRQRLSERKNKAEDMQRRPLRIQPHAPEFTDDQPPIQRSGSVSLLKGLRPEIQLTCW